jgi:glutamate/tyrosine decarboxylase-like PLP-dependent enzyme
VLVGRERHDSVDVALRYLGLGAPEPVAVDGQGRILPEALEAALASASGAPTLVVLQAGNLHSGAFDPFDACVRSAHEHGAWVHVDGAFGLWAAASPTTRPLTLGMAAADSWATDAHKTLNVPYDCGVVVVRDVRALHAAMAVHGSYLIEDPAGDPLAHVPEMSRRGRGVPVWAVLRSLGRSGVATLVDRLCEHARAFAAGIAALDGAQVLNDVVFTQVCATFGDDDRTRRVVEALLADGTTWMSGSRWHDRAGHDRAVLRISVSNWSTTGKDVERSLEALGRAARAAAPG